jgi:hypothetical protein
MSEQSVMTTPIFDELVNELGGALQQETAHEPQQDDEKPDDR